MSITSSTLRRIAAMPAEAMVAAILFLAEQREEEEGAEVVRAEIRRKDAERKRKSKGFPLEVHGNSTGIPMEVRDLAPVVDNIPKPSLLVEGKKEERKNLPPSPSKPNSLSAEQFLVFKEAYPKRDGDAGWKSALKAFGPALKRADFNTILAGAHAYSAECRTKNKFGTAYVKQARTWLNDDGWTENYGRDATELAGQSREELLNFLRS